MRDRFGREIEYVRVSVTQSCNLNCVYCRPYSGALDEGKGLKEHFTSGHDSKPCSPLTAQEFEDVAFGDC
jgi:hypothetical protein